MIETVNLKQEPLHQRAYQLLRTLILSGKLAPGQPFGETSLAADLGVSRTPVRDALRRLQQDRLITLLPGGNYQVYIPCRREMEEIYDCRACLEGMSARGAAEYRSSDHLRQLRETNAQMEAAYQNQNEAEIRMLDARFHEVIVLASANSVLMEIVGSLRHRLLLVRNAVPNPRLNGPWVLEQHQRILSAIADQNGDLAEQVMREHIAFSRKLGLAALSGSKE